MSYSCYEYAGICPGCGEVCKIESSECAGSSHDVCLKCNHVFNKRSWWQEDGMEKPSREQVIRYLKDFRWIIDYHSKAEDEEDRCMDEDDQKFWDAIKAIVNG